MTRLTFIPAQTIKVAMATRPDLDQFIVGGVHIAPGTSIGRVRLWKVALADLTAGEEIPFETETGKDDSVVFEILPTGDLLITISEATPGGGGSTAQPAVYRIAGVFPPQSAPPGGANAAQLAQHEDRLDWAAYQAGVTANALTLASEALAQAAAALILMAQKTRG